MGCMNVLDNIGGSIDRSQESFIIIQVCLRVPIERGRGDDGIFPISHKHRIPYNFPCQFLCPLTLSFYTVEIISNHLKCIRHYFTVRMIFFFDYHFILYRTTGKSPIFF